MTTPNPKKYWGQTFCFIVSESFDVFYKVITHILKSKKVIKCIRFSLNILFFTDGYLYSCLLEFDFFAAWIGQNFQLLKFSNQIKSYFAQSFVEAVPYRSHLRFWRIFFNHLLSSYYFLQFFNMSCKVF